MSNLVVIGFDDEHTAFELRAPSLLLINVLPEFLGLREEAGFQEIKARIWG